MRTARGLPSSRQDAKGQRVRYEYDKAIRLTALVNENNATYSFAYDVSDRQSEEVRVDNLTRRFSYNVGGHLTRLDELRGEIKYEYEANGQLRSRETGSLIGSEEFRYDPWGNLIEKRSKHSKLQHFAYDCENRLVKAETYVGDRLESTGQYRYDSLGRRVAKGLKSMVRSSRSAFSGKALRMLREETPGQSILYQCEPGRYAPLARVDQVEGEGQKVYYFRTDQIGTLLELTDSDGKIVWQATYRSWGEIELLKINQVEQNLRFQGQYLDSETALHQGRGTQRKMYYGIGIIIHLGPIRPLNRYFLATAKLAKILTGGSSSEFFKIAVGLRKPRAY
ncbi:hypothetical protein O999_13090 [Pseudomonas putida LF54]|jgi:YD repeat-containing protein|nr:hypothetical protein O999_13090 [Pseudomonas putida LF54]